MLFLLEAVAENYQQKVVYCIDKIMNGVKRIIEYARSFFAILKLFCTLKIGPSWIFWTFKYKMKTQIIIEIWVLHKNKRNVPKTVFYLIL